MDEIKSCWEVGTTLDPEMPEADVAALRQGWSRAVSRAKAWIEPA